MTFEQGPIRPPSEAGSVLVRVSRNCPWNRCAFCPVYKGESYSRRTVEEVYADLDALAEVHGDEPRTVFLQDADPLLAPVDDLAAILDRIRERFPRLLRVTAYARSRTLLRRPPEDLARLVAAGLTRLHVGVESGCDEVLALVDKGVTREQHRQAGRRAKEAGFALCLYVMPGLGGRTFSERHADDTASLVAAVSPDHTRLRTTAPVPGTPLWDLAARGAWTPLDETETVAEIRRFLSGLTEARTRVESDHVLNLLMYVRGDLPADLPRLLALCDEYLALDGEDRLLFALGRRSGRITRVSQLARPEVRGALTAFLAALRRAGQDPAAVLADLRRQTL